MSVCQPNSSSRSSLYSASLLGHSRLFGLRGDLTLADSHSSRLPQRDVQSTVRHLETSFPRRYPLVSVLDLTSVTLQTTFCTRVFRRPRRERVLWCMVTELLDRLQQPDGTEEDEHKPSTFQLFSPSITYWFVVFVKRFGVIFLRFHGTLYKPVTLHDSDKSVYLRDISTECPLLNIHNHNMAEAGNDPQHGSWSVWVTDSSFSDKKKHAKGKTSSGSLPEWNNYRLYSKPVKLVLTVLKGTSSDVSRLLSS